MEKEEAAVEISMVVEAKKEDGLERDVMEERENGGKWEEIVRE